MTPFDRDAILKSMTSSPGVYLMFNEEDEVIYVGKAKNLKKRLRSYFRSGAFQHDPKTQHLLADLRRAEVIIAQHENEALILENNLIKRYQPKYNILLKDQKTYPEIFISDESFPQIAVHRGKHQRKGEYFGPYPSRQAVQEMFVLLQKIFRLRQCDQLFFQNRTRPCLQYQIKRCSAPCVGKIDEQSYQQNVTQARQLLMGQSEKVINDLKQAMHAASEAQAYEQASLYRDQLAQIRDLQQTQCVQVDPSIKADVLAISMSTTQSVVSLLMVRSGRLIGHHTFEQSLPMPVDCLEALWSFMSQYYLHSGLADSQPHVIYITQRIPEVAWLANVLHDRWGHAVRIVYARQGLARQWGKMAQENADHRLHQMLSLEDPTPIRQAYLQALLGLSHAPDRMICFDVSHHAGEATRVSCVAATASELDKEAYRLYLVQDVKAGDDYHALRSAMAQYIEHAVDLPDIILIDGGKGQLSAVQSILQRHPAAKRTCLLGIAKGASRKRGEERFFKAGTTSPLQYDPSELGIHWILKLRDEAHRFAITAHRKKKRQQRQRSKLELVEGIGQRKRQALLLHFGGWQGLERATLSELIAVEGVGNILGERIFRALHPDRRH